ncbi:hypothetical protein BK120_23520 [Paenibacillus sp. FSL A5-0031]|uniref:M1 family metallopeptidase n=1 Tax=Paenibacillus sp. FSL A5-0031 TaxID=1920420 RepID=UPI00096F6AC9|nr:M1 family metallopeptidase [Paenibacillus sp. FSL A5-0031]OME78708.1 hypothetical protein BK120_23520 [Paenibacillus sp. FSL A5-0031]
MIKIHQILKKCSLLFGVSIIISIVFLWPSNEEKTYPIEYTQIEPLMEEESNEAANSKAQESNINEQEAIIKETLYVVDIVFNADRRQLTGKTLVEVWNRKELPTDEIKFQLYLNAFKEGKEAPVLDSFLLKTYPNGIKPGGIEIRNVYVDDELQIFSAEEVVMVVKLNSGWAPKTKKIISFEWTATIPEIHHRVGGRNSDFWFGNVIPTLAVYDNDWQTNQYELIGDPFNSDIANFTVNISIPDDYQIIATGYEEVGVQGADTRTIRVVANKVRDFTFALIKNPKKISLITNSGVHVNLYYKKTEDSTAQKALKQAVAFLAFLENKLIDYPYDELDIVENEMFITGMEYPSMVYIDSDRLNDLEGVQTVMHEIAHQWFYNLLGNDQIIEPWLDEAFSTFYTSRYLQSQGQMHSVTQELLTAERKNKSTTIGSVKNYTTWNSYWKSVYQRGSYMLFDLQHLMGQNLFDQMMKTYVEKYAYNTVSTIDFRGIVRQYYTIELDSFWNDWFNSE